jgi:hypothetical protein
VIKDKIIAFFLLSLLLIVNWHNTIPHDHIELDPHIGHDHLHHHNHHLHGIGFIWNLVKQLAGNVEHPDQGENHLELFPNPNIQIDLSNLQATLGSKFTVSQHFEPEDNTNLVNRNGFPFIILSFSDPPFLKDSGNRGPPSFS